MKNELIIQLHKNFEEYAQQIDGEEFWFARDLQGLLGYSKWENFIKGASFKSVCRNLNKVVIVA